MLNPARRLIAIRPLHAPAWLRHATWFLIWGLGGFAATMLLVGR